MLFPPAVRSSGRLGGSAAKVLNEHAPVKVEGRVSSVTAAELGSKGESLEMSPNGLWFLFYVCARDEGGIPSVTPDWSVLESGLLVCRLVNEAVSPRASRLMSAAFSAQMGCC